jgi:predicted NBD/HSP70 family sugar kinase
MSYYIGIDIGGTATKHGILTQAGHIVEKSSYPTPASDGGPAILESVLQLIYRYKERYEISGVCISTAGMVDCEKGEVFHSGPLIPNYAGTAFKKEIERRFSIPCEVENDVNCAGLAEYHSGAAKGSKVALCLTVGTGIGGCAILNGEVLHGCSNSALEIGYMPMQGDTFERLGAASVLVAKVAKEKGEKLETWSGVRVFEQAKQGDTICISAIDEMCQTLGRGIATICYVLNPDVVVLGGGIMSQESYLRPRIEAALQAQLEPILYQQLHLEFAYHQNDAGMLGAFYHFRKKHVET